MLKLQLERAVCSRMLLVNMIKVQCITAEHYSILWLTKYRRIHLYTHIYLYRHMAYFLNTPLNFHGFLRKLPLTSEVPEYPPKLYVSQFNLVTPVNGPSEMT